MILLAMVAMILPALLWVKVLTVLSPRAPACRCPDLGGRGLWLRRRPPEP
jgi:hypothetical protein